MLSTAHKRTTLDWDFMNETRRHDSLCMRKDITELKIVKEAETFIDKLGHMTHSDGLLDELPT